MTHCPARRAFPSQLSAGYTRDARRIGDAPRLVHARGHSCILHNCSRYVSIVPPSSCGPEPSRAESSLVESPLSRANRIFCLHAYGQGRCTVTTIAETFQLTCSFFSHEETRGSDCFSFFSPSFEHSRQFVRSTVNTRVIIGSRA